MLKHKALGLLLVQVRPVSPKAGKSTPIRSIEKRLLADGLPAGSRCSNGFEDNL